MEARAELLAALLPIAAHRARLAGRYLRAHVRWASKGFPTRSPQQIAEIFDVHCAPCKRFDKKRRACEVCGCAVRRRQALFANKLALESEHCPKKKW